MKIKMFHVKHFPPGMNVEGEKFFFGFGMCAAFFYSWSFIWRYLEARMRLSEISRLQRFPKVIYQGTIEHFSVLLGNALIGFWFVAIGMMGFAIIHYAYFWQGSKSIYVMKRLPNKMELYKRVWTLPLISLLLCAVTALVLLFIYYGVYVLATPKQCLPLNLWPLW